MKEVIIDGSKYNSAEEIHKFIGHEFAWPYYGHNLSALRDFLTTDVERPFTIRWTNAEESLKRLGKEYQDMAKVLKDIEENDIRRDSVERFYFIEE